MADNERAEALRLILAANSVYPIRWVDHRTSMGDWSGRDVSIDVFNIESAEQRNFLLSIEGIREALLKLLGSRCIFIFHTPQATKEHYADVVASIGKAEHQES